MSATVRRSRDPWAAGGRRALLLLTLALALAACGSCSRCGLAEEGPGAWAPPFQLERLGGGRFYLAAQRGRPVLLLFWTTSCEVCKRQMVELEGRLDSASGAGGPVAAAICADPENRDLLTTVARGLGLGYPILLDQGGRVTESYGVRRFPTTVVIDASGRIHHRLEGYETSDRRALLERVRRLALDGAGSRP